MISLDFLKALLILGYLISLIKHELNIWMPYKTFFSIITAKTPFLSSLLIFLYYKSIKRVSCTKTDISVGGFYLIDIPVEVR